MSEEDQDPHPDAPQTPGRAIEFYRALENMNIGPNNGEDPNPLPEDCSDEERKIYVEKVNQYSADILKTLDESSFYGEAIWIEFTATFRRATIENLNGTQILKWIQFLISRGVHVERKKGLLRLKTLLECLERSEFVPVKTNKPIPDPPPEQKETRSVVKDIDEHGMSSELTKKPPSESHDPAPIPQSANVTDEDCSKQIKVNFQKTINQRDGIEPSPHSLGINGLMQSYQGRPKYSGSWDEDLLSCIQVYDTLSCLCNLSDAEKAKAIPVMQTGDALSFYSTNSSSAHSYDEGVKVLTEWYTSNEQKGRVLTNWQSMRLSEAMREEPEKSELQVFRTFSHKLCNLQKQLASHYHHDNFLRDQLIVSTDIPQVQQSLRERIPASAQDTINRIATHLSNKPRTAGAFSAQEAVPIDAFYSLGHKYGGAARQGPKYQFGRQRKFDGRKRISSAWLRGKKGCYVCGENHFARDRHTKEEVRKAIQRMKDRSPNAFITMEDLVFITDDLCDDLNHCEENDVMLSEDDADEDDTADAYYSEETKAVNQALAAKFCNHSFSHGRTFRSDLDSNINAMTAQLHIGEEEKFDGIFIDTCANRSSVICLAQYRAYCLQFGVLFKLRQAPARSVRGIGGMQKSIGSATIPIPFKDLKLVIDVTFQVMRDNVPTLLCMKDMLDNGLDISIQERVVIFKHLQQPLHFENYFLKHRWTPDDLSFCLFTEQELRQLHRAFGHPSTTALGNILQRARPDEFDSSARKVLHQIASACSICASHAQKPRRFRLTVGADDLRFNHSVAVDIMYISGQPVLHIVDEATHFTAATFLKRQSSSDVWKALLRCWNRVYLGPPDFLHVDQGTNLTSKEILSFASADGITLLPAPIESPYTMTHVERYHPPLKAAYMKIRASLPRTESNDECLQMAVSAVNATTGPEGLCPTLLVFGALPRPSRSSPATSQLARAKAIDDAMNALQAIQAQRRVSFSLKHTRTPKGREQSVDLRKLPAGASVQVFRESSKTWEGPFPFISVSGETAVIQLPHGRRIFRSTAVRPTVTSLLEETSPEFSTQSTDNAFFCIDPKRLSPSEREKVFSKARQQELQGLFENGTFEIVCISEVPVQTRIYGTRFVDTIKESDGGKLLKSRLVAQNYADHAADSISTRSPTISRVSQRIVLSIGAMYPHLVPLVRDITQAYPQSASTLERKVYLRPPKEAGMPPSQVLRAVKPLYGIPEAGLHWFLTYRGFHTTHLNMTAARGDPCLLFKQKDNTISSVTALQVDDTFSLVDTRSLKLEERISAHFKCKERNILQEGSTVQFNGATITLHHGRVFALTVCKKLGQIFPAASTREFISTRAKLQYAGVMCRPDICAHVQLLATMPESVTETHLKRLNFIIKYCFSTASVGLKFVPLDTKSLRLALFTDAAFANTDGFRSQLGFVLVLVDRRGRANIVPYGSTRCQRVTRSVMAAEVHGLIYGFDASFVVRDMLQQLLSQQIHIDVYIDSRILFNVIAKQSSTLEKRLQIDIFALKESHSRGEIRNLSWIPSSENIADDLTKLRTSTSTALTKLMNTNELSVNPLGWLTSKKGSDTSHTAAYIDNQKKGGDKQQNGKSLSVACQHGIIHACANACTIGQKKTVYNCADNHMSPSEDSPTASKLEFSLTTDHRDVHDHGDSHDVV